MLALLRQASVEGRLTVEELADRAERAQVARTIDELSGITADLVPHAPEPSAVTPAVGGGLGDVVERQRGQHARQLPVALRCGRGAAAGRADRAHERPGALGPVEVRSARRR